jgi:hypothetical protein
VQLAQHGPFVIDRDATTGRIISVQGIADWVDSPKGQEQIEEQKEILLGDREPANLIKENHWYYALSYQQDDELRLLGPGTKADLLDIQLPEDASHETLWRLYSDKPSAGGPQTVDS